MGKQKILGEPWRAEHFHSKADQDGKKLLLSVSWDEDGVAVRSDGTACVYCTQARKLAEALGQKR
ncbi:hypothetical protein M514_27655 [Trichuris suis]|uniref:Uncharacterized protein n=1 Tax=Trichuris suis TaxID=68888 RepID=A0A085MSH8_9BILA|nr:hypothetical protein M514_27655 [Trichuris suis]